MQQDKEDRIYRVSDPETIKHFMTNHVWLDIVDQVSDLIESLRDDLEETHVYVEGKAIAARTDRDDIAVKGQIRGLRDVLNLPEVIMDHLLAEEVEQTEEEQQDA